MQNLDTLLSESAFGVGFNMMAGIDEGMRSMIPHLMDRARTIANSIKGTIQSTLEIRSPSRVMERLGEFIGDGLTKGMDKSLFDIMKASARMTEAVSVGSFENSAVRLNSANSDNSTAYGNGMVSTAPNIIIQNMYIRDESDIHKLAREMHLLSERERRAGTNIATRGLFAR